VSEDPPIWPLPADEAVEPDEAAAADKEVDTANAYSITRAWLSLFVPGGGILAEILTRAESRAVARRYGALFTKLDAHLIELTARVEGITPEGLAENDSFITTLMHVIEIARRTHQEEKQEALRNAVLNAAMPSTPNDDLQLMFLNFVDTLTPTHLRILKFLNGPAAWLNEHGKTIPPNPSANGINLLDYAMPEVEIRTGFFSGIPTELEGRGLLDEAWNKDSSFRNPQVKGGSRTTPLGKAFLAFIADPLTSQE
jgi:hypothetical protein